MSILEVLTKRGSTGVACIAEGRDFVGIEQNESFVAIAKARCNAVQMRLI